MISSEHKKVIESFLPSIKHISKKYLFENREPSYDEILDAGMNGIIETINTIPLNSPSFPNKVTENARKNILSLIRKSSSFNSNDLDNVNKFLNDIFEIYLIRKKVSENKYEEIKNEKIKDEEIIENEIIDNKNYLKDLVNINLIDEDNPDKITLPDNLIDNMFDLGKMLESRSISEEICLLVYSAYLKDVIFEGENIQTPEVFSRIFAKMDKLTYIEKLILFLYYKEELTYSQISFVLEMSKNTIFNIHTLAISKLKN